MSEVKAEDLWGKAWSAGWKPDPALLVHEWADAHRQLSPRASLEHGQYRSSRTPYIRGIADELSTSSPTQEVVLEKGAQIAATEGVANNWLGYVIHHAPGPFLMVLPSIEEAKKESKQRIGPMLEETPVLAARISPARSRESSNTILVKEFPGGIFFMVGANSPKGLRGRPIRYLCLDEVDEYEGDVGGQGDPIVLARARTSTFGDRAKVLIQSTPTVKGRSRIHTEFLRTDQRRFYIPCPACGHFDWIRWENIRWENDDPSTVHLICVACGVLIPERCKTEFLEKGEWRPTAKGAENVAGFHLSALYSPVGWKSWETCVKEFIRFKDSPFEHKAFVNLVWGEPWEERGSTVEPESLLAEGRRESWPEGTVPEGVGCLVGAADIQDDRIEVKAIGFGAGEESWLVSLETIVGDPGGEAPWYDLDKYIRTRFLSAAGRPIGFSCFVVDSGGHHTDQVYKFCKLRQRRRVFAIKGLSAYGRPLIGRPSRRNRYRAMLFPVCSDTGKEIVYSRLALKRRGPGYMHLPEWIDEPYVLGLTAERAEWRDIRGRGSVKEWHKLRPDNEPLDLEVYCLAALHILPTSVRRSLSKLAARLAGRPVESEPTEEPSPKRPPPRKRARKGWAQGWI